MLKINKNNKFLMHLDECGIDPILAKIDQVCHKNDKKISSAIILPKK